MLFHVATSDGRAARGGLGNVLQSIYATTLLVNNMFQYISKCLFEADDFLKSLAVKHCCIETGLKIGMGLVPVRRYNQEQGQLVGSLSAKQLILPLMVWVIS